MYFGGIFLVFTLVSGSIITKPADRIVFLGDDAIIDCSTDRQNPVTWWFTALGSDTAIQFYLAASVIVRFESVYSVDTSKSGHYTLVIRNVAFSHAGRYDCIDNHGMGDKASSELNVLERPPRCGYNSQHNATVELWCDLEMYGNLQPELHCSHEGHNLTGTTIVTFGHSAGHYKKLAKTAELNRNMSEIIFTCTLLVKSENCQQREQDVKCFFSYVEKLKVKHNEPDELHDAPSPSFGELRGENNNNNINNNNRISVIVPVIVSLLVCAIVVVVAIVILMKRRRNRNTRALKAKQQTSPTGTADGQGPLLNSPADSSNTTTARGPLRSQSCSTESDDSAKDLIS